MLTTACIVIPALVLGAILLFVGWHILEAVFHLTFGCLHLLFEWPTLLAILVVIFAVWLLFLR